MLKGKDTIIRLIAGLIKKDRKNRSGMFRKKSESLIRFV